MSLTQEQRAARIRNLCISTTLAIKNAYVAKIEERRDIIVRELLIGLVTQVAQDARELVEEYGTNTHSFAQLNVYEKVLREILK